MVIGTDTHENRKDDGWVNPHLKDGPCLPGFEEIISSGQTVVEPNKEKEEKP